WEGDQRKSAVPVPWTGNAWILDLASRKVVWELSSAQTSAGSAGLRTFNGSVRLPEGSYVAYYASYPDGEYWSESDKKSDRQWHWFGDQPVDKFKLVIRGAGQKLSAADVDRLRQP